jgi:hypothetical protein
MIKNTRDKAILCIKVRDELRQYTSDDIGQYFDLVSDNLILNFINTKSNKDNLYTCADNIMQLIFTISINIKHNKNIPDLRRAIDLKYSKKELVYKIINLNYLYNN